LSFVKAGDRNRVNTPALMDIYIDFLDKMILKSQVKKYPLTAERRPLT